jgi:uncharacterized protein YlaN (UPF0358 family)
MSETYVTPKVCESQNYKMAYLIVSLLLRFIRFHHKSERIKSLPLAEYVLNTSVEYLKKEIKKEIKNGWAENERKGKELKNKIKLKCVLLLGNSVVYIYCYCSVTV